MVSSLSFKFAILVGVALLLGVAQPATGAEPGAGQTVGSVERWSLSVGPYGWMPFLKGDQTVRGRTVSLDLNPIDVLESLESMPWMSYVEARKGRLAFYNDVFYAKLGADTSGTVKFLGIPTVDVGIGVEFQQTVVELGGAYEIARWHSSASAKDAGALFPYTAIDVLAGARYWHQALTVNLLVGGTPLSASGSVDWIDPLIGMRMRHMTAPGQELMLRADIGGFDVGSKFSWNVMGAYSWDIATRGGVVYSGILGYRALSVDFDKGSGVTKYGYDMLQHGPVMGLTAKF